MVPIIWETWLNPDAKAEGLRLTRRMWSDMRGFEGYLSHLRISAKPDTRSDDGGHPRSIATQAGQLFIRLSAMGQGGGRFAHGFPGSELDAVRIADQPVK